jgi:hypothetical protein
LFEEIQVRRYVWEKHYTAEEYITLLNTFSGHIAMDEAKREHLYQEIRRRIELVRCLGRRWRKEQPHFWQTLSPLGIAASTAAPTTEATDLEESDVPVTEGPSPVERMRERLLAEAHRHLERAATGQGAADWTSPGINGLMLDPDEEPGPEEWR